MIVSAASGEQVQHEIYGQRYLVLHDGYRYEGQPGTADFRVTHFNEFGQYMPPINLAGDYASVVDAVPTWSLLSSDDRSLRATLQWRSAMPIMVLVMTVLAISFSKTNPRQGRFMKMLPAILMFVFYFVFLSFVRGQMAQGKWPIYPGLWAVHGGFLLVGWWLFTKDKFARSRPLKLEDKTVNA
jgi:lipopolysaccharide export system permease protein